MKLLPPLVKVPLAHVLSRLNKVSPDTKEFSVDWANSSPFQIAGFSVFSISGLVVIVVMIVLIQAYRGKLFCKCIKQCALTGLKVQGRGLGETSGSGHFVNIDTGTVQNLCQDENMHERYFAAPNNSQDDIQDNVMEMTPLAQSDSTAGQRCHPMILTP